jgi:methyltransferase (TIGR00027 family)
LKKTEASRTALGAAAYRAAHQILDTPVVFADPLAVRILGEHSDAALRRQLDPEEARSWSRLRAFIAARSRFTEEALDEAVRSGTLQFVVLGAGLDTFAYRSPYGPRLAVFEIDHPATQAFKRVQLEAAGIDVPPWLTFVPVDFEHQSLIAALEAAGFRRQEPALFSWLGVTMYSNPNGCEQRSQPSRAAQAPARNSSSITCCRPHRSMRRSARGTKR